MREMFLKENNSRKILFWLLLANIVVFLAIEMYLKF